MLYISMELFTDLNRFYFSLSHNLLFAYYGCCHCAIQKGDCCVKTKFILKSLQ